MTLSEIAYAGFGFSGFTSFARHLNRRRLMILAYHGLHDGGADSFDNFDGLELDVSRFERQMEYLSGRSHVIPLGGCLSETDELYRVVVTFDDAYASVYDLAFPVLKRLGLPATVFVPTDFVEGRQAMWWDRLRAAVRVAPEIGVVIRGVRRVHTTRTMAEKRVAVEALAEEVKTLDVSERERVLGEIASPACGGVVRGRQPMTIEQMREMGSHNVTFESHGRSHVSLPSLAPDLAIDDLLESKRRLEQWFSRRVEWVAYPYGHYDDTTAGLIARAGFRGAVTTEDGFADPTRPFALRRVCVGDPVSFQQFLGGLSGIREVIGRTLGGRG